MRELVFTPLAQQALEDICEFVESKNTEGSGLRFQEKFYLFLTSYLKLTNLKFPYCNNEELAKRFYSCVIFQHKWVIAFRYTQERITIHRIVLGSNLT